MRAAATLALALVVGLLLGCRERLPSYTLVCRDGTSVTSHRAVPPERVCAHRGRVSNSITIVDGGKRRGGGREGESH
jgi:hypothetical protein